ncbi:MAG TPA: hypothetical protein VGN18_19330 [Jatrophihabitans sp.]|jgi:hypothetical protein|uniref:hypothetical protein n=1 Tax=Jatrophihabitans sp. TaxID=1932789 RepID=UPI002DFB3631|nr:hypothetical protein [Jatrophihabitans sp.]
MTSPFLTDAIAREHVNSMLEEAATGRAAHRVARARRRERRAARQSARGEAAFASRPAGVARSFGRPVVAFQHWLAAGQL